jgi:hypothetical protein
MKQWIKGLRIRNKCPPEKPISQIFSFQPRFLCGASRKFKQFFQIFKKKPSEKCASGKKLLQKQSLARTHNIFRVFNMVFEFKITP